MLEERFEATITAAAAGDSQAFAALWRDAQPMLLRYLTVTAGVAAEDVASQTWLRVVESLASFRGTEPQFRRWLVTIARNLHVDGVRRDARRPVTLVEEPADFERDSAPDAAEIALDRISTASAVELVARLPAAQAELVMLRVVMGLDVAEVAEIVGKNAGAVRVSVHRALKKLEEILINHTAADVTQSGPASSSEHHD